MPARNTGFSYRLGTMPRPLALLCPAITYTSPTPTSGTKRATSGPLLRPYLERRLTRRLPPEHEREGAVRAHAARAPLGHAPPRLHAQAQVAAHAFDQDVAHAVAGTLDDLVRAAER